MSKNFNTSEGFFIHKVTQASAITREASVLTNGGGCGRGNQLKELKWQQKLQESVPKELASFAVTAKAQEHGMFPHRIPVFWGCPASQKHQEYKKNNVQHFITKLLKK